MRALSLKGCKRASAPFQKPYLFKIHDHLPELEVHICFLKYYNYQLKKLSRVCISYIFYYVRTFLIKELDLSYCRWLSGHSLLLLSKMLRLKKLWLRGCVGLGECVAYASLSTRFGFKALEVNAIKYV